MDDGRMKTTYKGYEIYWSDNHDCWSCQDVDFDSPSLVKMKTKIDDVTRVQRKAVGVACFVLPTGYSGNYDPVPATIVEFKKTVHHRAYGLTEARDEHRVAAVSKTGSSDRASRKDTKLDDLMPDTPEALAAYGTWRAKAKEASRLAREATILHMAIPRMPFEAIQDLVKLKESES